MIDINKLVYYSSINFTCIELDLQCVGLCMISAILAKLLGAVDVIFELLSLISRNCVYVNRDVG